MKKLLILIMAVSSTLFVGCDYDTDHTPPNYVSFQRGPTAVGVDLNGSTSQEITVYTGNIVGNDRTFDIRVLGTSTLNAEAYTVPATVTVPGGTNEATFTVDISDVNISPEGSTIILGFAPADGLFIGSNHTLNVSQLCDPDFRMNFAFDGYASETSWELHDSEGNLVFAGAGFSDGTPTASVMRCINPGVYTFTVYDAYGDGLTYPNEGSVTLLFGGEQVGFIAGDFGEEASVTFNTAGGTGDGDTDEDEEDTDTEG